MSQTQIIEPIKKVLKINDGEKHSVCAYCRVSTDEFDQKNSLTAQKMFFSGYFEKHINWNNVGIFADEGISGTSLEKRDEFNRMISLAQKRKIDIILTKEVSRFSRNVRDLLNIVEDLRKKEIYIWFLSDDINTESDDYRERLVEAATAAEKESLRTSRRVKWGHQQQMQRGVVFGRREMFGYHITRDEQGMQKFEIIPEEAAVIKSIFEWFAAGDGTHIITRRLEAKGIKTNRFKNGWSSTAVLRILRNEKYVGDLAQGKTYTPDPLTHKKKYNNGESQMVYITDHHTESAIIPRELWEKVQLLLKENKPSDEIKIKYSNRYWTSGKVFCGCCGSRYISYTKRLKSSDYKALICFENHRHGQEKKITADSGETYSVGCNNKRVNDK
ncbi:MAG: recombinase family protein, partial [Clostridia bacterium]|nr:recombinase family protein [Clostridia bacterium]